MSSKAEVFGTWSIGQLIEALRGHPAEEQVRYDFGGLVPTCCGSYRGFYDHLALGWSDADPPVTVRELIDRLEDALGELFDGWKGGEYRMDWNTPLWIDNPGRCSSTAIVGVSRPFYVVIETKFVDV